MCMTSSIYKNILELRTIFKGRGTMKTTLHFIFEKATDQVP